jgi:hypothetical protein
MAAMTKPGMARDARLDMPKTELQATICHGTDRAEKITVPGMPPCLGD